MSEPVDVIVLKSTHDFVKVKLPFVEVPVEMSHTFFRKRMEKGYFKVKQKG